MKYLQNKDIVARTVAGENLLVPINQCTKKVFALNNVGKFLWEQIAMARSEPELASAVADRYGIEPERAAGDVQVFLAEMVRLELVAQEP